MRKPSTRAWGLLLPFAVVVGGAAACGDGMISGDLSSGNGSSPSGANGSGGDGGAMRGSDGGGTNATNTSSSPPPANGAIPCDVQQLLQDHCLTCHSGATPQGKITLTSYADLTADSPSVSGQTVAQDALARMQNGTDPMPPKPAALVPATEIAAFKAWIDSGYQGPACGGDGGAIPDPYNTPLVCTSGVMWTRGDHGSSSMHPGGACINCHDKSNEAPTFDFAGTVYPTAHEPDDCNGVASTLGAKVVITDSQNHVFTVSTNSAGNFYREPGTTQFVPPYTAKVTVGAKERAMTTPQTTGDCNGCHTVNGTNMAPGRIMAP